MSGVDPNPRRTSIAQCLLHASLVAFCVLTMFGCATSRRAFAPDVLRLATLQIDHARGTDGRVDLKRIVRLLKTVDADVVALQGVDRWSERSDKDDQIVSLAEALEMTYTYSRVSQLESGETGNALLTRYPIIEERHVDANKFDGSADFMMVVLERRGQQLVIVNTDLGANKRHFRLDLTLRGIETTSEEFSSAPIFVCGFVADYSSTESPQWGNNLFGERWSEIPLTRETMTVSESHQIERGFILLNRRSIESGSVVPLTAETLETDASTHRPFIVEFRIKTD